MEHLLAYLAAHPKRTDAEWAQEFGVSRPHFTNIRNGVAQPSKKVMARMARLTNNQVPVWAWFQEAAE